MSKRALTWCAVLLLVAVSRSNAADAVPDFSGVWLPNSKASGRWPEERPYTQAMQLKRAQWLKANSPINLTRDDDHISCLPYTLPYMMTTITQYPFEIVASPGQLHLFTETFGQVRRIPLDGAAQVDVLPSRTGVSRGHWEGAQLVVETRGILPDNEGSRFPSSPALRMVERFSLERDDKGARQLVNEITVEDPLVYEKPIVIRMIHKAAAADVQVGEYICQQDVWDQHLDGGRSKIPWR